MRRSAVIIGLLALVSAALIVRVAGADDTHTYRVELDNAFGLNPGSNVRIAGVNSGTVKSVDVNEAKRAVAEIEVSGDLSQFHADAHCSSEPQSLIAEYFLDCQPGSSPKLLPDDGEIPVSHTTVSVQNDLVLNTLREPFRQRLTLILNEFGTGLAGNSEHLNAAIRRGVPALRKLRTAFTTVSSERHRIRALARDAEQLMGKLAQRRQDVASFIVNGRAAADATAARREDLARDLQLLPGFLTQLRPSMDNLRVLAAASTPVLANVHASAGRLFSLSRLLPQFARESVPAIVALGDSSVTGRRAVVRSADEVRDLKVASKPVPNLSANLASFLRDLDDPNRATEPDTRAATLSGRKAPTGFTGFEGLANLTYWLTNSSNQFDQIGHLTQFSPQELPFNPCSVFNGGPTVPSNASTGLPPYGTYVPTTDPSKVANCVMWLGPRQPGVTFDAKLKPYDPSVCPDGSTDTSLCNPSGARVRSKPVSINEQGGAAPGSSTRGAEPQAGGESGGPRGSGGQQLPGLPNLPNLPNVPGVGQGLGGLLGLGQGNGPIGGLRPSGRDAQGATGNLLNFLLAN